MVAVLLAEILAVTPGGTAPAPAFEEGMAPYLTPQLVEVGKGRTINLVCLGQGSPTVILSAGLSGWSFVWGHVQPALAEHTRVCAWDRAGYGFSSPSGEQQDIVHTTGDVERALSKGGIHGPYVMVGHSFGAYESLRFTDLHRQSVIGMVLVDPDIPDRAAVDARVAPQFAAVSQILQDQSVKHLQDCAAAMKGATLKSGNAQFELCTAPPLPDSLPRLKAAIARLNADPARLLTQASLENEHATGNAGREVINLQRHYGDMPLIVLTAGRDEESALSSLSHLPPGTPGASTPVELEHLRQDIARFIRDGWIPAHEAYAALSTRGRHQLVPDSGHNIMVDKPDVVIAAIIEVLNASQAHPREP
jgi:pimeloyl-ACP methyl ester carboxylesterase